LIGIIRTPFPKERRMRVLLRIFLAAAIAALLPGCAWLVGGGIVAAVYFGSTPEEEAPIHVNFRA